MGGLNREGGLISNFDSERRGLLERGLNREGGLKEDVSSKFFKKKIFHQF